MRFVRSLIGIGILVAFIAYEYQSGDLSLNFGDPNFDYRTLLLIIIGAVMLAMFLLRTIRKTSIPEWKGKRSNDISSHAHTKKTTEPTD
jgi:hypothetical protein